MDLSEFGRNTFSPARHRTTQSETTIKLMAWRNDAIDFCAPFSTVAGTMSDPVTPLHYAPNGNLVNGQYVPGADGFNLADVSSKSGLDSLPAGVQGLVYLGLVNGVDATFQNTVSQYIGDPKLFGFYLVDEPDPTGQWGTQASAPT